jgi:hypothetical protein
MSVAVPLDELAAAIHGRGPGFLLTVADDQRARVCALEVRMVDGELVAGGAGPGTRANVAARPDVTLLWPAAEPGGMSLIVDGRARLDADVVVVTPTWAVHHRAAPPWSGRAGDVAAS